MKDGDISHFEESNFSVDKTVTGRKTVTQGVSRHCVIRPFIMESNGSLNIAVSMGRWRSELLNVVLYSILVAITNATD